MASNFKATKVPPAWLARAVEWIRHYLYRLHQRLTPAPAAMMEMIIATWTSQAITVAAQLGVADALADGPLPIDELAARVGADADALHRLLRALIGKGVFRHRPDGRCELNSLAGTLRSDAPISMMWAAQFYGSREQRERWTLMADAIRTGSTVVPALRGAESFDYFAGYPEFAELFNQTMTSVSQLTDGSVVAGYDFSAYPTIVDVGGGRGPLLAAILAAAPDSRGVLYDLPRVVADVPKLLRDRNLADRVCIAEGSFFDSVPCGGDAYILKNVIHDWPDEKAVQILRNVRAAAGPLATVLLVELVIPEHDRDFPGKWVDLEMLLNLGARERTATQYRDLLSQAGFQMTRVVQTASPLSVVEARPA
ncbi:methyltransferase [Mycobacterium sp. 852002-51057_SCH5723018]|uniref:methyltransferase n=1 Tax=Mycobacterium sp. 852002-51057_SCH5723018 TaxID=1834094 RepID=UPI000800A735|nr:methyltransferase [Mycobacterium sp. 852002-51057_SCH5723018]OBG22349.1 hydroxyneurosporene methyltransferase [Mycobacterium sp. 852002-51057_SCH5723018]